MAILEDMAMEVSSDEAETVRHIIDRTVKFLERYGDYCTTQIVWNCGGGINQYLAVKNLVADIACIIEESGVEIDRSLLKRIFSTSSLFNPFYISPYLLMLARTEAIELISKRFPGSNSKALSVVNTIFEYLRANMLES